MQYLQKRFSSYANYNSQPKCICGKEIKIGYSSKEGYLCQECYFAGEKRKEEKTILRGDVPGE